jgi:hypothetical protein
MDEETIMVEYDKGKTEVLPEGLSKFCFVSTQIHYELVWN